VAQGAVVPVERRRDVHGPDDGDHGVRHVGAQRRAAVHGNARGPVVAFSIGGYTGQHLPRLLRRARPALHRCCAEVPRGRAAGDDQRGVVVAGQVRPAAARCRGTRSSTSPRLARQGRRTASPAPWSASARTGSLSPTGSARLTSRSSSVARSRCRGTRPRPSARISPGC
jgi:hypothetical protein